LPERRLDRHTLDRDTDRAPFLAFDYGDDLSERLERVEHRPWLLRGHDHGEVLGRVLPPTGITGNLPAERLCDPGR